MGNWNPVEKPYRVNWRVSSSAYGTYGWRGLVEVFATEAEAREFASKKKRAIVQVAINPETWLHNGKWKTI